MKRGTVGRSASSRSVMVELAWHGMAWHGSEQGASGWKGEYVPRGGVFHVMRKEIGERVEGTGEVKVPLYLE